MKSRIKGAWLKALRSGDYTQGVSSLREKNEDGGFNHCCLGVLLEVIEERYPATAVRAGVTIVHDDTYGYMENGPINRALDETRDEVYSDTGISPLLLKELDLGTEHAIRLADMNDGRNREQKMFTFEEIADYIEKEL